MTARRRPTTVQQERERPPSPEVDGEADEQAAEHMRCPASAVDDHEQGRRRRGRSAIGIKNSALRMKSAKCRCDRADWR
jgi:hypothetical protein